MDGVLKDESTYYGDSEEYTGDSGSSTNMWVVEDIYDFVKSVQYSGGTGTNQYIRLVNDIDFNDHSTYKRGISSAIYNNNNYYLYGDNHKIKNVVAINATSNILKFQHIERVDFVNLVAVNCNVFPMVMVNAENCDFGMFISNSKLEFTIGTNTTTKIMDCTFNIKGKVSGSSVVTAAIATFQACHFNFDVNASISRYLFNGNGSIDKTYINCYFTGRVNNTYTEKAPCLVYNSDFTNCYFAFEWTGVGYTTAINNYNRSSFSGCFVDTEVFNKNGAYWQSVSGVSELTTAQAQDADYLNSIGFLVIPVE